MKLVQAILLLFSICLSISSQAAWTVVTPKQGAKLTIPSQFYVWNGRVPNGGTSEGDQHKYKLSLILTNGQQCTLKGVKASLTSRIMFVLKTSSCSSTFRQSVLNKKLDHIRFYGNTDGVYIQSIRNYKRMGYVNVAHMDDDIAINFPFNRWVDDQTDDRQMAKDLYVEGDSRITKYEITVVTSTVKKAGTDARIRLSLIDGNEVNSVYNYQPDDKHNNFEKGSVDKFALYTKSIPNLSQLCVSNDGRGDGPGWKPKHIIVKDTKKNKVYRYDINKWVMGGDEICTRF